MANGTEGAESVGSTVEVNRSVEPQDSAAAQSGKEKEAFRGFVDDASESSSIPTEISSPDGDSVGLAIKADDIVSFAGSGTTSANGERSGEYFGAANTHKQEATESELLSLQEETDGADIEAIPLQSEDFDTAVDDNKGGGGSQHEESRPEGLEESKELGTSQLQSEKRAAYKSEGHDNERGSVQADSVAENEDEPLADQGELSADRKIRNEISPGPQTTEDPLIQDQNNTEPASPHGKPADKESMDVPAIDAEDEELTSAGFNGGGSGDEAVAADSSSNHPEPAESSPHGIYNPESASVDGSTLSREKSSTDETPASDSSGKRGEDKAVNLVENYDVLAHEEAKEETVDEKFGLLTDVEAGNVDDVPLQDNLTKEGFEGEVIRAPAKAMDVGKESVARQANGEDEAASIPERAILPLTMEDEDLKTSADNDERYSNEEFTTDEAPATTDPGMHAAEEVGADPIREEFSNEKMFDESHEEGEVDSISEHAVLPTIEDENVETSTDNEERHSNEEPTTNKAPATTDPGMHAVEKVGDPIREEFSNEKVVDESNEEGEGDSISEHAVPLTTVEDENVETSTDKKERHSNEEPTTNKAPATTDPGMHVVDEVGADPIRKEFNNEKMVDESNEEGEVDSISEHAIPPLTVESEDVETSTDNEDGHFNEEVTTDEAPATIDPGIHAVEDAEDVGSDSVRENVSNEKMADEIDSTAGAEDNKDVSDVANTDLTNKDRVEIDSDIARGRADELHLPKESSTTDEVSSPVLQEDRNWENSIPEGTPTAPEYADAAAVGDGKDTNTASVSEEPDEDAKADYKISAREDPHALKNAETEVPVQPGEVSKEYSFESRSRPDSSVLFSAEDAQGGEALQRGHEENGKGDRLALEEASTAADLVGATADEDDGKHFEFGPGDEDHQIEGVEHVMGMQELGKEPSETAADPNDPNVNDARTTPEEPLREDTVTEPPVLAGESDGVDGAGDKDVVSSTFEEHLEQPPSQEDEVKSDQVLLDDIPSDEGHKSSSPSINQEPTNLEQDLVPSAVASSDYDDEDKQPISPDNNLLPKEESPTGESSNDAAFPAAAVVEDKEASPGPPEEFANVDAEANELVSGNSPAEEATTAATMGETAEGEDKSTGPDEMFAKVDTEANDLTSEEKVPSEEGTPADSAEGTEFEEKSAGPGKVLADAETEVNESISKEVPSKEASFANIGDTAEVEEKSAGHGEVFSGTDTDANEVVSRESLGQEASSTDVGETAEVEENSAGLGQVFVDADTEANKVLPKEFPPEETTPADIGEAVEVEEERIPSTETLDNATVTSTNSIEATAADEGEDVASANFHDEPAPRDEVADEGPTSQVGLSQVKAIGEKGPSSPTLAEANKIEHEFQSEPPGSIGEELAMDDNVMDEVDQSSTAGNQFKESPKAPVYTFKEEDAGPMREEEGQNNEESTEKKISSTDSSGNPLVTDVGMEAPGSSGGPAEESEETEEFIPAPESPKAIPVADNKEDESFSRNRDLTAGESGEEEPSARADFTRAASAAEDAEVDAPVVRDGIVEEYAVPPSRESPGAATTISEVENDAEPVTEDKELTKEDGFAAEKTVLPAEGELSPSVEDPSQEDSAPQDEVGESITEETLIPAATESIDDAENDGDAQLVPGDDLAREESTEMKTLPPGASSAVGYADEEAPTAHDEITKEPPGTDEKLSPASDAEGGDSTMDDQGVGLGTWVSDLSTKEESMEEEARESAPNPPASPADEKPQGEAPADHTEQAKENTVADSSVQSDVSSADDTQREDDKDDNVTGERKPVKEEGTAVENSITPDSEVTLDLENTKDEGAPQTLDEVTGEDRGEDQVVPDTGSAEAVRDERNDDDAAPEFSNDAVRENDKDGERLIDKGPGEDASVAEKTAAVPADSPTIPRVEVDENPHATELAGDSTSTSESASAQEPGKADSPERVDEAEPAVGPEEEEDGVTVHTNSARDPAGTNTGVGSTDHEASSTPHDKLVEDDPLQENSLPATRASNDTHKESNDDELLLEDREQNMGQSSAIETVLPSEIFEVSPGVEDMGEDDLTPPRDECSEDTREELSPSGAIPFHDDTNTELGNDDRKISSEVEADETRASAAGLTGGDLYDESQKPLKKFGSEGTAADESGSVLESNEAAASHEDGGDKDSGTMTADFTEEREDDRTSMTTSGEPPLGGGDDERLDESQTFSSDLNLASDEPFRSKFTSADTAEKDMDVVEGPAGTTEDRPTEKEINEAANTTRSDVGSARTEIADKEIEPTDERLLKAEDRENELPSASESAESRDEGLEPALAEGRVPAQPANEETEVADEDLFQASTGVAGHEALSAESNGTVPVAEENEGQASDARAEELKGDEERGSVLKHDNSGYSETEEPQKRATEQTSDTEEASNVVASYPTDEPSHLVSDDTAPRDEDLSPNPVDTVVCSKDAPDRDFQTNEDITAREPSEAAEPPATPASLSRTEPEVTLDGEDVAGKPGPLEEVGKEDSNSPSAEELDATYEEDLNGRVEAVDTTGGADGNTQKATKEKLVMDYPTSGVEELDPDQMVQEKARAGTDDSVKTLGINVADDNIDSRGEVEMPGDTVSDGFEGDQRIHQIGIADKEYNAGKEASKDWGNDAGGTENADHNAQELANDGQHGFVDPSAANSSAAIPDVEPFPELSIHSSSFAERAQGVAQSEGVAKPDQKTTTGSGRKAVEEDEASVPLSTHTSDLSASWVSVDAEDARPMSDESRPSVSLRSQSSGRRDQLGSGGGDWRIVSEHNIFDSSNSLTKPKRQESVSRSSGFLVSVVMWCSQSMGSLFGGSRR